MLAGVDRPRLMHLASGEAHETDLLGFRRGAHQSTCWTPYALYVIVGDVPAMT